MRTLLCLLLALVAACQAQDVDDPAVTLRFDAEAEQPTAVLHNGGGRALTFHGYGLDGPFYQIDVLVDGEWRPHPLGWCGTGAGAQQLPAGESTRFGYHLRLPDAADAYRLALSYRLDGEEHHRTVRTPPEPVADQNTGD